MIFSELIELFKQKVQENINNKRLTLYAIGTTLFEGGIAPLNRIIKGRGAPKIDTIQNWFNDIGYDVHIIIAPKGDQEIKELSDRMNRDAMEKLFDQIANTTTIVRRSGPIVQTIADIVDAIMDGKEIEEIQQDLATK